MTLFAIVDTCLLLGASGLLMLRSTRLPELVVHIPAILVEGPITTDSDNARLF